MCDWSMGISLKHERDIATNTNVMQETCVITNVKTFGERLIWARERLGWTQERLAVESKISQSAIGNYESGLRKSSRQIVAIARVLGVRAEWLTDGTGTAEAPSAANDPTHTTTGERTATREANISTWPFSRIKAADVAKLDRDELNQLEGAIGLAVAQLKLNLPIQTKAPAETEHLERDEPPTSPSGVRDRDQPARQAIKPVHWPRTAHPTLSPRRFRTSKTRAKILGA